MCPNQPVPDFARLVGILEADIQVAFMLHCVLYCTVSE